MFMYTNYKCTFTSFTCLHVKVQVVVVNCILVVTCPYKVIQYLLATCLLVTLEEDRDNIPY